MRTNHHSQPAEFQKVADAPARNWVDNWAPIRLQPYLRLARLDRPIGTWLLLWPCLWSVALADLSNAQILPNTWYILLFAVGAIAMRGAGCVYNDLADRDFDGRVNRTRSRPIPSGQVTVKQAILFLTLLALIGLLVLLQFNGFTIFLGVVSLAIVAIYPFMKRITYWPQLYLGLAFSWGALMGWSAVKATIDPASLILYAAAIFWTIGYDTIYAHQDKEDDALLGLKSTALKFGKHTKPWLVLFYALALSGIWYAGFLAGGGVILNSALIVAGLHMIWQIKTLDIYDSTNCLIRFRSNRDFGLIVFSGIVLEMFFKAQF